MNTRLPIIELDVDDLDASGIQIISFVEKPAMEVTAIKLSAEEALIKLATNEYKQYLTSAVIIPDKPIIRLDAEGNEYYIKFSVDAVERIRNKFFAKSGKLNLSNKNHDASELVDAQLIEMWIITDSQNDKANALGFKDLPNGTLMATYKINDTDFWDKEVLTGNVTGFSLEGVFSQLPIQNSKAEIDEWKALETSLDNLMKELDM
jgi:hypothetical protein